MAVVYITYHVFHKDNKYDGSRAFFATVHTYEGFGKNKPIVDSHTTKLDRITPSRAQQDALQYIHRQLKTKYLNYSPEKIIVREENALKVEERKLLE